MYFFYFIFLLLHCILSIFRKKMEKDFRLIVKNLPTSISETQIKDLFEKYVTVNKVDLKEKKDFNDQVSKFSFVNVSTTDRQLNSCCAELNNKRIDGSQIIVELAKESFLDRLKKERVQEKPKTDFPWNNNNLSFDNSFTNINGKSSLKKFSDQDLILDDYVPQEKKRKKLEDNTAYEDSTKFKDHVRKKANNKKVNNNSFTETNNYEEEYYNEEQNNKDVRNFKSKEEKASKKNKFNNHIDDKLSSQNISDGPKNNESEKKRLMSVKQKRQVFRAQEQIVRNALKLVDGEKPNKKIVFGFEDDNLEESGKMNGGKKDNNLFDSDDEDGEDYQWNEDELDAKADLKKKLSKFNLNTTDKRFVLDERFVDEDEKVNKNDENEETSTIEDEKKWQLNILEGVLGKSLKTTSTDDSSVKKKNRMIRYDPTASNHEEFEIPIEKSEDPVPKKKKKKSDMKEVREEEVVPPVSTEIFYEVSDKLIDDLKTEETKEEFSLFKALGRTDPVDDDIKEDKSHTEENENYKFEFSGKNPFKYDSSDDEGDEENEEIEEPKPKTSEKIYHTRDDKLFFDENDSRFLEAKQFFETKLECEEDSFKNRRRELKEIVRTKIRRNLKKTVPWNRRKVRKMHKIKK